MNLTTVVYVLGNCITILLWYRVIWNIHFIVFILLFLKLQMLINYIFILLTISLIILLYVPNAQEQFIKHLAKQSTKYLQSKVSFECIIYM